MERDKAFLGLIGAVFLMMIGVGMIVALLPQRVIELDGHSRFVGYLASAFALSYVVLQVPIGSLADRFGFKPFLVGGYGVCFIAGLLFYFSDHSSMLFWGRLLQGVGEAPVWALAPALLALRFPRSKGKVMGIYNATIHLGLTAGPLAGIILAQVWQGREAFLLYAALCLLGAVVLGIALPGTKPATVSAGEKWTLSRLGALLRQGGVAGTLAGIALYGAGYGIFLTNIPAYLLEAKDASAIMVGIFFALFYLAVSVAQVVTGPLTDRLGSRVFMAGGVGLAALGLGASPFCDLEWLLLLLSIGSLGMGVFCIASMTFLQGAVPDALKGTIGGAYYLFWGLGMFVGPPLFTMMAQGQGYFWAMQAYVGLLGLGALGIVAVVKRKEYTHIS
ncbi:MAG: MFS transporter [Negativicutes bacterium]